MINLKRINGITLSVSDLDRSLKWYEDKFGLTKLYDDAPNSNGVVIGKNNIELCLIPCLNDSSNQLDHAKYLSIKTLSFEIDKKDLLQVENEFKEDNDIIILDSHPKYKSRIVEDPDGHAIELFVNKV